MAQELKVGDVVRLNGHGLRMTVSEVLVENAIVMWFDALELKQARIPIAALHLCDPAASFGAENAA